MQLEKKNTTTIVFHLYPLTAYIIHLIIWLINVSSWIKMK